MPCIQCENGYKWGETGDCKYKTLQECQEANTYDIVELVIDENNEALAIDAISLVTSPAIEQDFIYFNAVESNLTLASVDEEQRLIVSPALIPYKQIYRYDAQKDKQYYVYFTADTVRQAAEAYMKHHNTNNATIQHEDKVTGVHTIESWLVQDSKKDKSNLYGYELPAGTWFVSMRVENDAVWERIKSGELKGLSIEGYFVDKMETLGSQKMAEPIGEINGLPLFENEQDAIDYSKELGCEGVHRHEVDGTTYFMPCSDHEIVESILEILEDAKANEVVLNKNIDYQTLLNSYSDYPKAASNNAKKAIKWKEKNGSKCGTRVGWTRARQLADRKPISRDTIARMASFKRHQQHKDVPYSEGCGGLMWDAWGGSSGVNWAISKLKQIDRE